MYSARRPAIVVGLLSLAACGVQLDPNRAQDTPSRSAPSSGALNRSTSPSSSQDARFPRTSSEDDEDGVRVLPVFMLDLSGKEIVRAERPGVLKVIEDHDGSLKDLQTSQVAVQSKVSIEIHGDTSAGLAKKSYRFELVDDKKEDRELPLLGLPAGSDWVLHSCGSDRTCLRNVLAYALGRELGHYAPRTRFIELFVNGDYRGIYVLVERIRRDRYRVDLPRPSESAADGDITGGYIFRMDLGEGKPTDRVPRDWVSPVSQTVYSYYYPRFDQITAAQKAYLHDHVSRFEKVMQSGSWSDPHVGYRHWLDVRSWVDFALVQELSVNPDAYFKSIYLQKWPRSSGDKIALGPFWDFDLAFGVAEFRDARNTETWAHLMNRFGGQPVSYDPPREQPYVPAHWERLWADPAFHRDLRCRWQELRKGPLQMSAVNAMIDRWVEELAAAQPRDAAVWGNPPANAYVGEVLSLKDFLGKRVTWMDANLPGRCEA
jgi:hypothetical protein